MGPVVASHVPLEAGVNSFVDRYDLGLAGYGGAEGVHLGGGVGTDIHCVLLPSSDSTTSL